MGFSLVDVYWARVLGRPGPELSHAHNQSIVELKITDHFERYVSGIRLWRET